MRSTTLIYFCTALVSVCTSAPEFDLKIEYNETFDKQGALDKLDIAFVNKVNLNETALVNNQITDGKLLVSAKSKQEPNNKHGTEKNGESEVKYVGGRRCYTGGLLETLKDKSARVNSATFKHLQPQDIKLNLNSFKMARKNSFYVTPAFQAPSVSGKNGKDSRIEGHNRVHLDNAGLKVFRVNYENGKYQNVNYGDLDYELFGNTVFTKDNARDSRNRTYKDVVSYKNEDNQESDILSLLNNPEVAKILKKQTALIVKLEKYLRTEKMTKLRSDFDDLLTSIENKKNVNKTIVVQDRITEKTTPPARPSTVMTVVDQTEVRRALFKDPFVQRILKMTQRKKMAYMKNAKKQYTNMLYI